MIEYLLIGVMIGIAICLIIKFLDYLYKESRLVPDFTDREIHELKNVVRERLGGTVRPLPPGFEERRK